MDLLQNQSLMTIRSINDRARSELTIRLEGIRAREDSARRELVECEHERSALTERLQALDHVEHLYAMVFASEDEKQDLVTLRKQTVEIEPNVLIPAPQARARIGDQRYKMLKVLQAFGDVVHFNDIVTLTKLEARRVREQMSSDANAGVVSVLANGLALTSLGRDLIERFEESRQSRGLGLPDWSSEEFATKAESADSADDLSEESSVRAKSPPSDQPAEEGVDP